MALKINYKELFRQPDFIHQLVQASPKCVWFYCIDPSGSEKNGQGSTGIVCACATHDIVLWNETISFAKHRTIHDKGALVDYLEQQIDYYCQYPAKFKVIIEDYISYGDTMGQDAETKYVVDAIHIFCKKNDIDHDLPIASEHKTRFTKERLQLYGVEIEKLNTRHEVDALKMFLYDTMFHQNKRCRKCHKIERRK